MPYTDSVFNSPFNGVNIACVQTRPQNNPSAVVLLVHGIGGQKNSDTHIDLAPKLAEIGIASLRFDFPGHGESGGCTLDLTIGHGAAVVDQMYSVMRKAFPDVPTGILGASFGGSAILQSKACGVADALVLRSPVSDYCAVRQRQLGAEGLRQWQRDGQIDGLISGGRQTPWRFYEEAATFDFFHKAKAETSPLLIVQGTKDATVPMDDTVKLITAWAGTGELVDIHGGDHSLSNPLHTEMFIALSSQWFASHLL